MTERERIGRLLHAAHGTWRKPHLLRWEESPEVQELYMCMADAVIEDRAVEPVGCPTPGACACVGAPAA